MSINEPVTLNMEAAPITEHLDSNIIETSDAKVLKSLLLYGPNASGKSNLLRALVYFRWLIVKSATEMNISDEIKAESFLLDEDTEGRPSFFELGFSLEGVKYRYGAEIDKTEVHREWLLEAKRKKYYPLFLRGHQEFEIDGKRFEGSKDLGARTRKNALFLSVCAQWSVDKAEKIVSWFDSINTIHGLNDDVYRESTLALLESKDYGYIGKRLLQAADLGINGIEFGKVNFGELLKDAPSEVRGEFGKREQTLVFVTKDVYAKGEKVGERPFLLDESESDGTKKFFNLLGIFVGSILENRLVIIDEFDARLHTLLTKTILQLFNSSEWETSAQLLLTCHDTELIDKNILRRDQIYFVEKNELGATRVNSLVEFKVRKEAPFAKNYLNGKYGGIPILNDLKKAFNGR